jgi:hypothetical protein
MAKQHPLAPEGLDFKRKTLKNVDSTHRIEKKLLFFP